MNRKEFILILLSPLLALFGYKINIQKFFKKPFTFDPALITLVRKSFLNQLARDLCDVQPMSISTGLIFAMKNDCRKDVQS